MTSLLTNSPEIEVVEQKSEQLKTLAEKTQVLVTTVGPYARWGEPVVEACANAGTHYLDVYVNLSDGQY